MALKYVRLAAQLREELPHLRAQGVRKLPSESAMMAHYGVSRQTVRQALELLVEDGLVEKRHGSGTYLCSGAPGLNQIALVATSLSDYIFPGLLRDIQAVLSSEEYAVTVYASDNSSFRERQILQRLLQQPTAGVLIEGSRTALPTPNLDLYEQLQNNGVPLVFLHGAYRELPGAVCVGDDNYTGGYQLVRYLTERGHERIAGIFKSDDVQGVLRYSGCTHALRDAGLLQPDQHFFWFTTEDRRQLLEEKNPDFLRRFCAEHLRPCTAVLCYNDEIAYYLIQVLTEAGLRVPDDVAVVSFDNSYYSRLSAIPITSLGHEEHAVGHTAAQTLLRMIRGEPCESAALPWRIYGRESG